MSKWKVTCKFEKEIPFSIEALLCKYDRVISNSLGIVVHYTFIIKDILELFEK